MNPFKDRHFQRDIILWAIRWYCKFGISYPELQEMLAEREVNVDHSTIDRCVQRHAPEMEKRLRGYWRNSADLCPWDIDETHVKVNGRWAYLYRAVDNRGRTVDFFTFPCVVTVKPPTGSWIKSSTTWKSGRSRSFQYV